jgi:transposase-like protein
MAVSRSGKKRRTQWWVNASDTAQSGSTKVVLEAMKGHKTANEIVAEYGVHPTQIAQWKKQALEGLPTLFSTRASEQQKSEAELIATLYQQIGQLKVQVDWLEKKSKALH